MDMLQIMMVLQVIILLVTLKTLNKSTSKKADPKVELELDTALNSAVDTAVKNYEAKINKVVAKLTTDAEKELLLSTSQLTASYRQTFDQKLDAVISQWSDQQRQTIASAIDKQLENLQGASEALVQKVAEQSLKKHLTLKDHDQLVKNSLSDILTNLA